MSPWARWCCWMLWTVLRTGCMGAAEVDAEQNGIEVDPTIGGLAPIGGFGASPMPASFSVSFPWLSCSSVCLRDSASYMSVSASSRSSVIFFCTSAALAAFFSIMILTPAICLSRGSIWATMNLYTAISSAAIGSSFPAYRLALMRAASD
eukprot:9096117-Pyramimonas_sp.AAC.1